MVRKSPTKSSSHTWRRVAAGDVVERHSGVGAHLRIAFSHLLQRVPGLADGTQRRPLRHLPGPMDTSRPGGSPIYVADVPVDDIRYLVRVFWSRVSRPG